MLGLGPVLQAQDYAYSVLIDTDNDSSTGCPAPGGVSGIERRLTAIVSSSSFQITALTLQTCGTGIFGPPTFLPGAGYPVALNLGGGGSDAIELAVAESLVGGSGSSLVFLAETPACQDTLRVGGPSMDNPVPVPTLSTWGVVILALLLAVVGFRRRPPRGLQNMAILFLLAGVALAGGVFVADGNLTDWSGVSPAGEDATGDSSCGRPDADIVAGFQAAARGDLFYRIDIVDIEPVPTPTNSPPDLIPVGNRVITVGEPFSTTLFAVDPDPGDTLSFSLPTAPDGVAIHPATGLLQWTPGAAQLGVNNITARVTDSGGLTDSESFTIEVVQPFAVAAPNHPPVLDPIADRTLTLGENLSLQATASDPDAGDSLAFSLPLAPPGVTIDPVGGLIQWSPDAAQIGAHDIAVRVTDNHGLIDIESFIVTVLDVNRAPTAVDDIYNAPPGVTLSVSAPGVIDNDSDSDGDPLTATLVSDVGFGALDFRPDGSFDYTPGADSFEPKLKYRAGPRLNPGPYARGRAELSPVVADLDRDGTPEIIVGWFTDAGLNIALRILDGATGEIEHEIVSLRGSSITAHDDTATPAIGNLDDDPELEIVIVSSCVEEVIVFEHDLTLKWSTSPGTVVPPGCPGGSGGATTFRATLADLDGDGVPEILIPLQGTNNATWGVRVFNASGGIVWERRDLPIGGLTESVGSVTVADVDLDGEPEVIVGEALLSATGDLEWVAPPSAMGTYADGALVANLDDDPYGEILLIGVNKFVALNHDGTLLWDATANPEVIGFGENYSSPLVADLDGDGEVDVAAAALRGITVVKRDGTLLWQRPVCVEYPDGDHCSGNAIQATVRAITAFDFDGDGVSEIAAQLFGEGAAIVRGSDGERLWSVTVYEGPAAEHSSTHKTHPVVADVDGDGHAELVMAQGSIQNESNCNADGNCVDHGIYVYEGVNDDWMPARPLYNQLSYHNTNVLDGGAIPNHEPPHWLVPGLNRDRVNVPLADDDSLVDRFTYRVNDGEFDSNVATVRLPVRPDNRPPRILSRPQTVVGTGFAYRYKVLASDEDFGDVLTFTLAAGPAGMTIDAAGLLRWQPVAADLGTHRVSVAVTDQEGAGDLQSFPLEVVTPQAVPNVIGVPQATAESTISGAGFQVGAIRLAKHASVPAGAIASQTPPGGANAVPGSAVDLVVSLGPGPADTDDDSDGFTENQGDCNDGDSAVHPGAPDVNGDGIDQDCDGLDGSMAIASILVVPDQLTLVAGETAPLEAFAIFADGTSQPLTALANWSSTNGGAASVNAAGVVTAQAFGSAAIQASRGAVTGIATVNVVAADPSDDTVPIAEISSPVEGATVFGPVDIVGTADDGGLVRYEFSISPADEDNFTPIGGGTNAVTAATLGTFDPTLLLNDLYRIRLEVFDAGGNSASDEVVVQVDGNQKVGNFSVSFTDLQIPLAGIPISVTRTYDSRDKRKGDFGVGWRLGVQSVGITCTNPLGEGWFVAKSGLSFALLPTREHKCSVELPGRRAEEFDFIPNRSISPLVPFSFLSGTFRPRQGTRGTLQTLDNTSLLIAGAQPGPVALLDDSSLEAFEPVRFRYLASDGTRITFSDAGVERIADPNGNTITINVDGIVHSSGKRVDLDRDELGRVTTLTDPMGQTQTYRYSAAGDLISHTDAAGNATMFFYNWRHGLVRIEDPLGRFVARNEYDDDGRLVAVTDGNGNRVDVDYDLVDRTRTQRDSVGGSVLYEFDERGNILRVTDENGHSTVRVYDNRDRLTSVTDALGNTTRFTYDTLGREAARTDGLGNTTTYTYGPHDRVGSVTSPLGNQTIFEFDSRGNRTATIDAMGHRTSYAYDRAGNMIALTDAAGNTIRREYDVAGNRIRSVDASGNATDFEYDGNGRLRAAQSIVNGSNGPEVIRVEAMVDSGGRLVELTDADGFTFRNEYDAAGQLIKTIDREGRHTELSYDLSGRRTTTLLPSGETLTSSYDQRGNVLETQDPQGRSVFLAYDPTGRISEQRLPDSTPGDDTDNPRRRYTFDPAGRLAMMTDELGHATELDFDAAARLTGATDPNGGQGAVTYDADGRVSSETDAAGLTTEYQRDPLGRVIERRVGGDSSSFDYDAVGNLIAWTDPEGNITRYEYDRRHLLTAVIDALGGRLEHTYDSLGRRVSTRDAGGRTTRYEYDVRGLLTAVILPLGHRQERSYTPNGLLRTLTDFNGDTTEYAYDDLGRLTERRLPDGSVETFSFDLGGRPLSIVDHRGTTTYEYDVRGRLARRTEPDGAAVEYAWDGASRLTSVATSSGSVGYTYDSLGRLATVTDPQGGVTTYTWDPVGNLLERSFPNGVIESRSYDSRSFLTRIQATSPVSGTVLDLSYTYDRLGNRLTETDQNGQTSELVYDALSRLVQETTSGPSGSASRTYGYDAVGNRISRSEASGASTAYVYDDNDRLLEERTGSTITHYTYDPNGNRLSRSGADRVETYRWDALNRLTGLAVATGSSMSMKTYDYNALHQRVAREEGGATSHFLYDDFSQYPRILEEYRLPGQPLGSSVLGDTRLSVRSGGQTTFLHDDLLASVRTVTASDGSVLKRMEYSAFGEAAGAPIADSFLFTGEPTETETGLVYLRRRFLDTRTGTFLSRDPLPGDPETPLAWHPYLYAGGNPASVRDPSGLFTLQSVAVAVGIASGLASSLQFVAATQAESGLDVEWSGPVVTASPGDALLGRAGASLSSPLGLELGVSLLSSAPRDGRYTKALHLLLTVTVSTPDLIEAFAKALTPAERAGGLNRRQRDINRRLGGVFAFSPFLAPQLIPFDFQIGDATLYSPSSLGGPSGLESHVLQGGFAQLGFKVSGGAVISALSLLDGNGLKNSIGAGVAIQGRALGYSIPDTAASLQPSASAGFSTGVSIDITPSAWVNQPDDRPPK